MDIVTGRDMESIDEAQFAQALAPYASVLIDLGCGDGAFPYRVADTQDDLFCIGVDPNRESMAEYARRARRKPARGGRPNVLFVAAAAETLPPELRRRAQLITVNYPWAGLLQAIVTGDPLIAVALDHLAADVCLVQILLNADADVADLPAVTPDAIAETVAPVLADVDFRVTACDWLPPDQRPRSQWGGRLVRGSHRRTVALCAERGDVPSSWRSLLASALV